MKYIWQFLVCSLLLNACAVSRNWKGSDVPGHNYATFSEFSGKQKFSMKVKTGENCFINYNVKVQSGRLHIKILSSRSTLVDKEILSEATDSLQIADNKENEYTLILSGSKAAGSFDIKYGPVAGQ